MLFYTSDTGRAEKLTYTVSPVTCVCYLQKLDEREWLRPELGVAAVKYFCSTLYVRQSSRSDSPGEIPCTASASAKSCCCFVRAEGGWKPGDFLIYFFIIFNYFSFLLILIFINFIFYFTFY